MTNEEIDKIIDEQAQSFADNARDDEWDKEEAEDHIYDYMDSVWSDLGMPMCQISNLDVEDIELLPLIGEIIKYCSDKCCLEIDKGLWESYNPLACLAAQAYHSVQNSLQKKLQTLHILA